MTCSGKTTFGLDSPCYGPGFTIHGCKPEDCLKTGETQDLGSHMA